MTYQRVIHHLACARSSINSKRRHMPCVFRYQKSDPYAVQIEFPRNLGDTWLVDRQMLATGMITPIGEALGNIMIYPNATDDEYMIINYGRDAKRSQLLEVNRAELNAFLEATCEAVQFESEHEHVVAELDKFLGELIG